MLFNHWVILAYKLLRPFFPFFLCCNAVNLYFFTIFFRLLFLTLYVYVDLKLSFLSRTKVQAQVVSER